MPQCAVGDSASVPMHLLKEGTFVPFVKSHFMGPVVYLMVMTAPLLTATIVSTALLLQQSQAPQLMNRLAPLLLAPLHLLLNNLP